MAAKIKSKANEGVTRIVPKFGLARIRHQATEALKSDMHELRPGTARLPVEKAPYRKRGRS
jgi:hypothetical protein